MYTLSRCTSLALLVIVAWLAAVTPVFAGSTGGLSGSVTDAATAAPLVGANVTAVSPSQSVKTTTDSTGHFVFLSLAPDTYSVSIQANGFETATTNGITINADQTQRLTFAPHKTLKTIGNVTSRSAQQLVRPGAVADSYSVNAATQARITGLAAAVRSIRRIRRWRRRRACTFRPAKAAGRRWPAS